MSDDELWALFTRQLHAMTDRDLDDMFFYADVGLLLIDLDLDDDAFTS